MLSRFENEESDLSSQKLLIALNNIHTEVDEFFQLLKEYEENSLQKLLRKIYPALDQKDTTPLLELHQHFMKRYAKDKEKDDFLCAIITKAYLHVLDEKIKATDEELHFLHDFLFSVSIWGRYELRIFSVCSPLLTSNHYVLYIQELFNQSHFSDLFEKNRSLFHTIFLNGFFLCIGTKNWAHAEYLHQKILNHFYTENETYHRIVYHFAKGEYIYHQGKKEEGKQHMLEAIHIFRLLDCHTSTDYYQKAFDELVEKEG